MQVDACCDPLYGNHVAGIESQMLNGLHAIEDGFVQDRQAQNRRMAGDRVGRQVGKEEDGRVLRRARPSAGA